MSAALLRSYPETRWGPGRSPGCWQEAQAPRLRQPPPRSYWGVSTVGQRAASPPPQQVFLEGTERGFLCHQVQPRLEAGLCLWRGRVSASAWESCKNTRELRGWGWGGTDSPRAPSARKSSAGSHCRSRRPGCRLPHPALDAHDRLPAGVLSASWDGAKPLSRVAGSQLWHRGSRQAHRASTSPWAAWRREGPILRLLGVSRGHWVQLHKPRPKVPR